jgi:hypothetical protein
MTDEILDHAGFAQDFEQADRFLQLLGRNGDVRLRAFPHKHTPAGIKKKIGARKFGHDLEAILASQAQGRGIYLVVNRGGDDADSITHCLAYFAEFDGIPEADQLRRVQDSNLPEPSAIVRTGGASLHFYWILSEPIVDKGAWQQDMKRLAAHLGSDPSINDPCRVMRLPGCLYMGPDQQPAARVELIHESDARFTRDQIVSCLPDHTPSAAPPPPSPGPALAPTGTAMPLLEFISKNSKELVESGSAPGSNNDDGLRLPHDLIGTANWIIQQGCTPEPTARALFEQYVAKSATNYGPGFDHDAAWRRFDGAKDNPTPSTPEPKLQDRLAYHLRKDQGTEQQQRPPQTTSSTSPLADLDDDDDIDDDSGLSLAEQLGLSRRLAENRSLFTLEGLLPPDLAQALEIVHAPLPTDPLAAALALLAGYSGLLKLGTNISSSVSHNVPANLFLALVAPSGVAKTSVKRALVADPAVEVRRDAAREHDRAMLAWEEENKGKKKDDRTLPPRPVFPHLSDYTPAALSIQLMLDEARGLGQLITVDELSGLLHSIEADTKRGSGDGTGFTSVRVDAPPRTYEACHLSVYGNVQPDVLRSLINGDDATGTFARFLFCRVPLVPLQLDDDDPTPEALRAFQHAQQLLADYASRLYRLPPRTYSLSKQARADFHSWFRRYQTRALAPGVSNVISSLLGKSAAHALRIAGLLHILKVAAGSLTSHALISTDTMTTAMAVVDQLIDETTAFHEAPETDTAILVRHIHQTSLDLDRPITRQDARAKGTRTIRLLCSATAFSDAINQLAELGYGVIQSRPRSSSGRPKAHSYRATKPMP